MKKSKAGSLSQGGNTAAVFTAEVDELIRTKAYQLYEMRGREDGHDLDDWLKAESEVTNSKTMTVAA